MKFLKRALALLALIFSFLVSSSPAWAVGATLSLSPTAGTFNQGCSFSLAINLDTGGAQTDGTDAIIFYDPARFTVTNVHTGTIYQDYPTADFSTPGTVKMSGLASVGSTFSGNGVLGSIDFKVLQNAPTDSATKIRFDFDPNNKSKTTDSNVAQHGTVAEILNQVVDGSYNIGTNACGVTVAPTSAASGSGTPGIGGPQPQQFNPTPTPAALGNSGSETQTVILAAAGGTFLILGILGLALL